MIFNSFFYLVNNTKVEMSPVFMSEIWSLYSSPTADSSDVTHSEKERKRARAVRHCWSEAVH